MEVTEDEIILARTQEQLERKEFANLHGPKETFDDLRGKHLYCRAHQLVGARLMNPLTPTKRLLLKWQTGTGKTLGALLIADTFSRAYIKLFRRHILGVGSVNRHSITLASEATPNIFVLGFTKGMFLKELLRWPEFGFISIYERDELDRLQQNAHAGGEADMQAYKSMLMVIRRRVTTKARGGFYKFYGYQEFVNRLFTGEIDLMDIAAEAARRQTPTAISEVIAEKIREGTVRINVGLMKQFESSILICDEIHNTYNSNVKNNYGVAISYVLDSVESCRAVFLSTTPINNSPTEIVDVLGYLLPVDERPAKSDLFVKGTKTLKPGALELIGRLTNGKVSFVTDNSPAYYPTVFVAGETRQLAKLTHNVTTIPYLKFIPCEMSTLHAATYRDFLASGGEIEPDEEHDVAMPTDSFVLFDMVFPNPLSKTIGVYKAGDIRALAHADLKWKDKMGFVTSVTKGSVSFSGSWLQAGKIEKYYSKAKQLLVYIDAAFERSRKRLAAGESWETAGEKMIIYHERVRGAGVLLLAAIMRENGIIDEYSDPVDSTRCCVCGVANSKHNTTHDFHPARFALAHSDIDRGVMLLSIDKYNSAANSYGVDLRFLIGSRLIRESYDLKDTAEMHVLSKPVHMSALIQLRGRVDRHGSHMALPSARRTVTMYYYLTTLSGEVTPEEQRYTEKILEYRTIQLIEQSIHENAIDPPIHDIRPPAGDIGPLPFESKFHIPAQITTDNFYARGYGLEEIRSITSIIKRLFLRSPVWTYESLWAAVKSPGFAVEENSALYDEANYAVGLASLVYTQTTFINNEIDSLRGERPDVVDRVFVSLLFDSSDRYIWRGFTKYKIETVGCYYVRAQVIGGKAVVDVESLNREVRPIEPTRISLDNYVRVHKQHLNFTEDMALFTAEYLSVVQRPNFTMDDLKELLALPVDFSRRLLRLIISTVIDDLEIDDDTATLHDAVLDFYVRYGAIIFMRDIVKYRDVTKLFKNNVVFDVSGLKPAPLISKSAPIGYLDADGVWLYDSPVWINTSKASLNKPTAFTENKVTVGYYEDLAGEIKFKLRKPIASSRGVSATNFDARAVERGIVCATKNRKELDATLRDLNISADTTKIKSICTVIRDRLLTLESREIVKGSGIKWFYFWFDTQPNAKDYYTS
jgi:hypothetical protein